MAFDVDGTLTDGSLVLTPDGQELKSFHVKDGAALRWLEKLGFRVAFVTGRGSKAFEVRAAELGIERLYLNVRDKRVALSDLLVRA